MRIGCLQFAPQVADVDNNLNRADSVLSKANTDDLDLLVLPELAFSGYNFKSLQQISPFLEPSGSGITSLWARTTALKYNCNVVVGYPEKADVSSQWPTGPEYYNSAIVVNGDGETIANYRKSFLYYTDETWALEGDKGFFEGWIPGLGNTSIGICMDLNPYKFQAPWHSFEFAFHVLEYESNLVIVSMAWMTREDGRMFSRMPNEPDMDTLTYWVTRLEPLIRSENEDEIIVVFCNRTGTEDEVVYAGTSAVVGIQDGEVKIYGVLGRGEKELLVVDTNNPPSLRAAADWLLSVFYERIRTRPFVLERAISAGLLVAYANPANVPSGQYILSFGLFPEVFKASKGSAKHPDTASGLFAWLPFPGHSCKLSERRQHQSSDPHSPESYPVGDSTQTHHPAIATSRAVADCKPHPTKHTVTSNPRPPEDSTPYPHSGAPLSGYPTKNTDRRIYGGSVSISQMPFTPITPFDDGSPVEARYFWRPSDSLLKSPMDSRALVAQPLSAQPKSAVAEPDDTRTMSFHFPLFHEPGPRAQSSNSVRTVATAVTARKDNDKRPKDRRPTPVQGMKARASSKSRAGDIIPTRGATPAQDPLPDRPSSPKSRNASRSRTHERSDSALGNREHAKAVSQHLESISHRAESVNRNRGVPEVVGTPQPDRPSSPKSRNCSRSRPSEHLSSILIAASPSILSDEHPQQARPAGADAQMSPPQRSMSRMSFRARAGSAADVRPGSRSSMTGEHFTTRPVSRTASRGRQPGPLFSPPKMSPHDPSLPAEQSADEIVRIQRDRKSSIGSKPPVEPPAPQPDFARVESVVCPTCPVHGRHSTSSAPAPHGATLGHRTPSPDLHGRSLSSPAAVNSSNSIDAISSSQIGDDPKFSTTEIGKPSDVLSLTETIETISTNSRSPSTPFFEPKTPKAMVIIRDSDDSNGGPLIPDLSPVLSDLTCVDRIVGPTPDGSRAIAT
ncbi:Protein N-terminal amidase [Colletotrichum gloeosporioides]|uniref:Protein N-terminal amidase n=1 Tax=Colletotrichum gloeosporioides TaxID=474922 RepID=A0A8H4CW57_COLGL|nr:Protein N-terminal amidase [Colletotrichum gloeosporioides]KAF3811270.1 Protein N-terminal amidase [Colletotrichum gloeosporioides]